MKPHDLQRPHRFRRARKDLDLTQAELGAALHLKGSEPERTVRNWETARRPIPGPVAVAVGLMLEKAKSHTG